MKYLTLFMHGKTKKISAVFRHRGYQMCVVVCFSEITERKMGFISQKWLNMKADVDYRKLLRFTSTKTTLSQIFADALQS